jgi:AAA+ ATPase superfamily predicted ATPase
MSNIIDYFPSKLAKDPRFCNRLEERQLLSRNIELGRHTVLISPRRYGKSSLVHKVVADAKLPFASIDLFLAHDDKAITKRIIQGISKAINQIIPVTHKALAMVQNYFSDFKVILNTNGFGVQVSHERGAVDSIEQILDSLKSLVNMAEDKKKKVLLFIDEFQDITCAENSKSIQGAIRHVAQDTSNLVFIFSGSSRHLMLELFDDKNKPLYMLCDKIFLERISSNDYIPYIQRAAVAKWKTEIDERLLRKIFILTELHAFYINLLCNELWKKTKLPKIDDVTEAWISCYEIEERRIISELEKLTNNQQDILKALAFNPTKEPNGQKFLKEISLSISSVRLGIKSLLEKDMIYCVRKDDPMLPGIQKGEYRILDPLIAYALRRYD